MTSKFLLFPTDIGNARESVSLLRNSLDCFKDKIVKNLNDTEKKLNDLDNQENQEVERIKRSDGNVCISDKDPKNHPECRLLGIKNEREHLEAELRFQIVKELFKDLLFTEQEKKQLFVSGYEREIRYLIEQESSLEEKEVMLEEKEKELLKEIELYKSKSDDVEKRSLLLLSGEKELHTQKDALNEKEKELNEREEDITSREIMLVDKINILDEKELALGKLSDDIKHKEFILSQKEDELDNFRIYNDEKESKLNSKVDLFNKVKEDFEKKKIDLDNHLSLISSLEENKDVRTKLRFLSDEETKLNTRRKGLDEFILKINNLFNKTNEIRVKTKQEANRLKHKEKLLHEESIRIQNERDKVNKERTEVEMQKKDMSDNWKKLKRESDESFLEEEESLLTSDMKSSLNKDREEIEKEDKHLGKLKCSKNEREFRLIEDRLSERDLDLNTDRMLFTPKYSDSYSIVDDYKTDVENVDEGDVQMHHKLSKKWWSRFKVLELSTVQLENERREFESFRNKVLNEVQGQSLFEDNESSIGYYEKEKEHTGNDNTRTDITNRKIVEMIASMSEALVHLKRHVLEKSIDVKKAFSEMASSNVKQFECILKSKLLLEVQLSEMQIEKGSKQEAPYAYNHFDSSKNYKTTDYGKSMHHPDHSIGDNTIGNNINSVTIGKLSLSDSLEYSKFYDNAIEEQNETFSTFVKELIHTLFKFVENEINKRVFMMVNMMEQMNLVLYSLSDAMDEKNKTKIELSHWIRMSNQISFKCEKYEEEIKDLNGQLKLALYQKADFEKNLEDANNRINNGTLGWKATAARGRYWMLRCLKEYSFKSDLIYQKRFLTYAVRGKVIYQNPSKSFRGFRKLLKLYILIFRIKRYSDNIRNFQPDSLLPLPYGSETPDQKGIFVDYRKEFENF